LLKDGDEFDIGDGEKLKIMFTAAHQPSGLIIFEEKNKGLFINDIVGDYYADADFLQVLTPPGSDVVKSIEILEKVVDMSFTKLYLGHYGIHDKPAELLQRSLTGFRKLMEIAAQCIEEGKPEEIEPRVFASKLPEIEKLRKTRGETVYQTTKDVPASIYSRNFAKYYLDLIKK
jgi:glyoxylase-like metal-dependent hydrolase (beta-lactamase superfamily II)